jgi:Cu+-exporting ATPase
MTEKQKKKVELKVSGMTCASCATAIGKSLSTLSGVTNAQVDLENQNAVVEYGSTKLKLAGLEKQ